MSWDDLRAYLRDDDDSEDFCHPLNLREHNDLNNGEFALKIVRPLTNVAPQILEDGTPAHNSKPKTGILPHNPDPYIEFRLICRGKPVNLMHAMHFLAMVEILAKRIARGLALIFAKIERTTQTLSRGQIAAGEGKVFGGVRQFFGVVEVIITMEFGIEIWHGKVAAKRIVVRAEDQTEDQTGEVYGDHFFITRSQTFNGLERTRRTARFKLRERDTGTDKRRAYLRRRRARNAQSSRGPKFRMRKKTSDQAPDREKFMTEAVMGERLDAATLCGRRQALSVSTDPKSPKSKKGEVKPFMPFSAKPSSVVCESAYAHTARISAAVERNEARAKSDAIARQPAENEKIIQSLVLIMYCKPSHVHPDMSYFPEAVIRGSLYEDEHSRKQVTELFTSLEDVRFEAVVDLYLKLITDLVKLPGGLDEDSVRKREAFRKRVTTLYNLLSAVKKDVSTTVKFMQSKNHQERLSEDAALIIDLCVCVWHTIRTRKESEKDTRSKLGDTSETYGGTWDLRFLRVTAAKSITLTQFINDFLGLYFACDNAEAPLDAVSIQNRILTGYQSHGVEVLAGEERNANSKTVKVADQLTLWKTLLDSVGRVFVERKRSFKQGFQLAFGEHAGCGLASHLTGEVRASVIGKLEGWATQRDITKICSHPMIVKLFPGASAEICHVSIQPEEGVIVEPVPVLFPSQDAKCLCETNGHLEWCSKTKGSGIPPHEEDGRTALLRGLEIAATIKIDESEGSYKTMRIAMPANLDSTVTIPEKKKKDALRTWGQLRAFVNRDGELIVDIPWKVEESLTKKAKKTLIDAAAMPRRKHTKGWNHLEKSVDSEIKREDTKEKLLDVNNPEVDHSKISSPFVSVNDLVIITEPCQMMREDVVAMEIDSASSALQGFCSDDPKLMDLFQPSVNDNIEASAFSLESQDFGFGDPKLMDLFQPSVNDNIEASAFSLESQDFGFEDPKLMDLFQPCANNNIEAPPFVIKSRGFCFENPKFMDLFQPCANDSIEAPPFVIKSDLFQPSANDKIEAPPFVLKYQWREPMDVESGEATTSRPEAAFRIGARDPTLFDSEMELSRDPPEYDSATPEKPEIQKEHRLFSSNIFDSPSNHPLKFNRKSSWSSANLKSL
ncbi:hypothetical protein HDU96_001198 [Phlyctochytrium bullatum]|nr:hypothetical protein HDU96_001198 [Phlyctochytrium bullatum]